MFIIAFIDFLLLLKIGAGDCSGYSFVKTPQKRTAGVRCSDGAWIAKPGLLWATREF
jgi:hypothetical protein